MIFRIGNPSASRGRDRRIRDERRLFARLESFQAPETSFNFCFLVEFEISEDGEASRGQQRAETRETIRRATSPKTRIRKGLFAFFSE
jgi:hypothetical protein